LTLTVTAVQHHHDQDARHHNAIHDRPHQAGGKRFAQLVQGVETGLNISESTPFEKAERQVHQMSK
jgi:hypothetical protein